MRLGHLHARFDVRIASDGVRVRWQCARGRVLTGDVAAGEDAGQSVDTVRDALNTALAQILKRRGMTRPHVRVAVATTAMRSGVLRFDELPRNRADCSLLVSQRFCREHKRDARDVAVAFSVHPRSDGRYHVLVDALPRMLIESIVATFAAHDLHCDVVTSDHALALAHITRGGVGEPGALLVIGPVSATVLLLEAGGIPANVASLNVGAHEPEALQVRLSARFTRYADHLRIAREELSLHVCNVSRSGSDQIAASLAALRCRVAHVPYLAAEVAA